MKWVFEACCVLHHVIASARGYEGIAMLRRFFESKQDMDPNIEALRTYKCRYQQATVWRKYFSNIEDKEMHRLLIRALMKHIWQRKRSMKDWCNVVVVVRTFLTPPHTLIHVKEIDHCRQHWNHVQFVCNVKHTLMVNCSSCWKARVVTKNVNKVYYVLHADRDNGRSLNDTLQNAFYFQKQNSVLCKTLQVEIEGLTWSRVLYNT